jgi:hypothetical protein
VISDSSLLDFFTSTSSLPDVASDASLAVFLPFIPHVESRLRRSSSLTLPLALDDIDSKLLECPERDDEYSVIIVGASS